MAIQTGSNSTLLLAFVMLGLILLAMFLTHDTLQGLTMRCDQPAPAFAGEPAHYSLQLDSAAARPRCSLRLQGHAVVVCDRIWRLHHGGARYGLQIQGLTLAPSKGVRHRDACLEALATA